MIVETVNMVRKTVRQIFNDRLNRKTSLRNKKTKGKTIALKSWNQKQNNWICLKISCDKTWIFQYRPETNRQATLWKTPISTRTRKVRMSKSQVRAMMIICLDIRNVFMTEWVPKGQTVNQRHYLEVLTKL
jgi:hypothetical protein